MCSMICGCMYVGVDSDLDEVKLIIDNKSIENTS